MTNKKGETLSDPGCNIFHISLFYLSLVFFFSILFFFFTNSRCLSILVNNFKYNNIHYIIINWTQVFCSVRYKLRNIRSL